jgi:hypothetical protein
LAALNRHGVEYLVIGAFAAIAQGAPIDATYDVDVTPRRSPENLRRLSDALRDLDARIRVDALEEGLPFSHDAEALARMQMLNLTCAAGDFDLVFAPAASPAGYEDLVGRSVGIRIGDEDARAASLADIIRSKTEAGREKDIRTLPALRQFLRDHGTG